MFSRSNRRSLSVSADECGTVVGQKFYQSVCGQKRKQSKISLSSWQDWLDFTISL